KGGRWAGRRRRRGVAVFMASPGLVGREVGLAARHSDRVAARGDQPPSYSLTGRKQPPAEKILTLTAKEKRRTKENGICLARPAQADPSYLAWLVPLRR